MAIAALVVAAIALVIAYLAVRRAVVLDQRLSLAERELDQLRVELKGVGDKMDAGLQDIGREVRRQGGTLHFVPNMTIAEAMALHPGVSDVLANFHLGSCSNCAISDVDTLEGACRSYGIDERALMSALSSLIAPPASDLIEMARAKGRAIEN